MFIEQPPRLFLDCDFSKRVKKGNSFRDLAGDPGMDFYPGRVQDLGGIRADATGQDRLNTF